MIINPNGAKRNQRELFPRKWRYDQDADPSNHTGLKGWWVASLWYKAVSHGDDFSFP